MKQMSVCESSGPADKSALIYSVGAFTETVLVTIEKKMLLV